MLLAIVASVTLVLFVSSSPHKTPKWFPFLQTAPKRILVTFTLWQQDKQNRTTNLGDGRRYVLSVAHKSMLCFWRNLLFDTFLIWELNWIELNWKSPHRQCQCVLQLPFQFLLPIPILPVITWNLLSKTMTGFESQSSCDGNKCAQSQVHHDTWFFCRTYTSISPSLFHLFLTIFVRWMCVCVLFFFGVIWFSQRGEICQRCRCSS